MLSPWSRKCQTNVTGMDFRQASCRKWMKQCVWKTRQPQVFILSQHFVGAMEIHEPTISFYSSWVKCIMPWSGLCFSCRLRCINSRKSFSHLSCTVQLTNKFTEDERMWHEEDPMKLFFSVCLVIAVGCNQHRQNRKGEKQRCRSEVMIGCWPMMSSRQHAEQPPQHLCHIPFHSALLLMDPNLQQL